MDADLFRILYNAVEELGLEWSPPEEPSRSRLNEWFLPGCRQAPRQRASPFFPEVHDVTKSWGAPNSSRLRASSSSALTSVNGAEENGYNSLPPLDESVAANPCPPMAFGWKPLLCLLAPRSVLGADWQNVCEKYCCEHWIISHSAHTANRCYSEKNKTPTY